MRLRARRAALVSLATVLVLVAAGLTVWWIVARERDGISSAELRKYPPIVIVWADNARAGHTRSGDLYVVRADGASARRVKAWLPYYESQKDGVYGTYDAQWSPDRKLIALMLSVWYGDPYSHVAVASPDGRRLQKVESASGERRSVAWSPDGRELVYSTGGELWTYSPARRKRTRIFKSADYFLWGTDWAPGSRHIAAGTPNGIVKVSREGTRVVRVTRGNDWYPVWSPDGRAIAFLRARGPYAEVFDLYVVGAEGQGLRRLVRNASDALWSHDGRSILFERGKEIGVIRADGRDRRTLTSGDALAQSPDGRKILFLREAEGRSELWVMDTDGKRQTRLPFGRPRWTVITADWGR